MIRGGMVRGLVALAAWMAAAGIGSPASATEQLIFGPTQYASTARPPNQPIYTDTFALPATLIAPFRLHVQNGNADGTKRISSAALSLNGSLVAGPSDLSRQVAAFDKTVTLQASNTLQVVLSGSPGTFIVVTIFGTVPPPTLTSLLPSSLPIAQGSTGTLTATITAAQPTPTTINVTSDNPNVAAVPATATVPAGQLSVAIPATGVSPGTATITATLNGSSASSSVRVSPAGPTITSLLPATLQVTQGASGSLTVTLSAVQAADTVVTLATSDAGVVGLPAGEQVTVPAGQVSQAFAVFGVAPGTAAVTASLNGTSGQSQVSVVVPLPMVVSLLPPVLPLTEGSGGTLTVTLNAAQPTPTDVALSTSDASIVGLPPGNQVAVPPNTLAAGFSVAGLQRGTATVTASLNGSTTTAAVEVQPPLPTVQALACPATLTPGATALCTVTLNATQLSDTAAPLGATPEGIVTLPPAVTVPKDALSAPFAITGLALGAATLTAGPLNNTTKSAEVQVVPPPPTIVSLAPASASVFVGATVTLKVKLNAAQLVDTAVPLASSAPGIASVPPSVTLPAGALTADVVVTGVAPGLATISAGPLNDTQAKSTVTVNQLPPTVAALSPPALSLPKGRAGTLTVTIAPTQPDPTVVSLNSDDGSVGVPASVTVPAGASTADFPVLANAIGSATITAGPLNGTSQQATVTVTPPELVSIAVAPLALSLPKGASQQFTATGTFTDASTQDVTASVAWSSSDTSIATITPGPGGGLATGVGQGSAQITAAVGALLSPPATLTVTPPVLASSAVIPPNPTRNVGQSVQFTATGTLTDGTTQDLTAASAWSSSDTGVATITSPGGLATALAPGGTTIGASHAASGLSGSTTLTVILPPPTLTGFSPTFGRAGDQITITGTNFVNVQSVAFNNVPAPGFTVVNSTTIRAAVPAGATTGPLTVITAAGTASSTGEFVVIPTQDFQLSVLPTTTNVPSAGQGAFNVSVTGAGGFTGLTTLAVSGVPPGVTATFAAATATAGQNTLLTVVTNGTTGAGSYPLTVTATGLLNGVQTTRSANITLQVQAAGATSLTGQVLDEDAKPVKGAVVKLGTLQTTSDDAGNFRLQDPPVGPNQLLLIDGGPASTPEKSLPIVPYRVTIVGGQANTLGFTPYLHFQKNTGLTDISNTSVERVVKPADLPGFEMKVPAGVTITGWDGQPNMQVSIRKVPADRAPLPPFPSDRYSPTLFMYYFGKPGGGTPSAPVPITYPNDLDVPPGTQVELWFYDEAPDGSRPNQWAQYGTGTVSADGSQIVPDIDPATGKPYGQPRFCCGAGRAVIDAIRRAAIDALRGGQSLKACGRGKCAGDPVDLATGIFVESHTDLVLPGRIPIVFTRTYRTNGASAGPFGSGTSHPYHILLLVEQNLRTLVLPGGARVAFPQQSAGTWQNFTDPPVRGAVIRVSGSNHVLRFKDGTGWTFGSPAPGTGGVSVAFLIAQADRNGNTITLTRSGSTQNLTVITEPAGRQLALSYDGSNRITTVTDPIGRSVTYSYNAAGLLDSVADPAGGVTRYTYDTQGRMLTATDPRGNTVVNNTYDANGRVVQQKLADGGTFQYAYTVAGGTITQTVVTNPRGNATTYRFNGQGYQLSETDALGQTTVFTRDPVTNLLLASTDPLGRVTRSTYDPNGNVTSVTDPRGNVWGFSYQPTFNQVATITDPLGSLRQLAYDPTGNLTAVADPLGHVTQFAYDQFGQPLTITDALGNAGQFAYTLQGDLATARDPLGNTNTLAYDSVSRLVSVTDARGKTGTFTYDVLNRVLSGVDPMGGPTAFSYDANGNLLSVTDPRGNSIRYEYDSMDRITHRIDPLGQADVVTYDPNGNVLAAMDRKGQLTRFTYDVLDRRARTEFADGSVATRTYDLAGRLTEFDDTMDPYRPITFEYDSLDRLVAETSARGRVTYQYDALDRRTQMTVAGQAPVTYSYDAGSRLMTLVQTPLNPVRFEYDALSRRTGLTLPNGVSTEYQYDTASRLTALIYRNASSPLGDLTYQYDAVGNKIGVGGAFARSLLPDPVAAATYDAGDRQLTFGSRALAYDPNGNLTSLTDSAGTTTFTWDARDRLVGLTSPGMTAAFTYGGGRRRNKTLNGQLIEALHDRADTIQEVVDGAAIKYLSGPGVDEPLLRNDTEAYLADAQGSVVALTDATGALTTEYSYEPFGRTATAGSPAANAFQFTGRENDGTGLYHYRARYYHPGLHRFISEDPLGLGAGDLNLYAYVRNNPVNLVDPSGQLVWVAAGAAVVAIVTYSYTGNTPAPGEATTPLESDTGLAISAGAGAALGVASKAAGPLIERVIGSIVAKASAWGSRAGSFLGRSLRWCRGGAAEGGAIRWNPLNGPGPLGAKVANTFRSASYTESIATESITLYRVYSDPARALGAYWTRTPPAGPVQSIIDSALDPAWGNMATNVAKIQVPAGTRIFEGLAAPQGGLVGGGNQIFLQHVDPSWIVR